MSLQHPQLQAFVAIAEQGTVHAAADVLHLTQTAVTQRLKNLEQLLNISLFTRTRRGMRLTPEGDVLLHYCQACQELELDALQQIHGERSGHRITVGITGPSTIMHSRVIPRCCTINQQLPYVLFDFRMTDSQTPAENLRRGFSQFAILDLGELSSDMQYKRLTPECYVLVCTPAWRERRLEDIIQQEHIIDFNAADQMTFNYLSQYQLLNHAKPERHFANRAESLAQLLTAGLGYGVLIKEFAERYVDDKKLIILNNNQVYEHPIFLAWYPRKQPPDYFQVIIDSLA